MGNFIDTLPYFISCQVNRSPCLYNITADPCEYNNLAAIMPQTLATLQARLRGYQESMVEPRNQPPDSAGKPIYHGGVWGPWVNLDENDLADTIDTTPNITCSTSKHTPHNNKTI